ncbi:MAG: S9 family peptidase [Eudoraea sp.]|nr:S9 family peptidase [Eudoraea sp.]
MNKFTFLLFCLLITSFSFAQNKKITLEELWGGAFNTEQLRGLRSMNDGQHYTILQTNSRGTTSSIAKYAYENQQKTATLVSSSLTENIPYFTSYAFSKDESKVLLATSLEAIYRRSKKGIYYVYDLVSKEITQVAKDAIQEPTLSPNGEKVAYVLNNDLFVMDIASGTSTQVTTDGETNAIINGVTDWVYEEEFSFVRAFEWNADGSFIAFLRFDERKVPEFSMDVYGSGLYPTPHKFKYPKAGEANAEVALKLYELSTGAITEIGLENAYYIPRMQWKKNRAALSVQTMNRLQNHLTMYTVNAINKEVTILHEETDAAYVDVTDDLTFLEDDSFIWTSEKDGFNHIYLHNKDGSLRSQLTKGNWEVTRYYGYDVKKKKIFYQGTENGSINRDVYSISRKGKNKKRLTNKEGTNAAAFSTDFTYFINTFSNSTTPPMYTLHNASNGDKVTDIIDNAAVLSKVSGYEISQKEFSTIAINGYDLNMWMMKPVNFDASKKYPLLLFQYSGPGSQQVSNRWMGTRDYWHQILASEGYIIACVDGRGTGLKGRDFKKLTYKELGKYEVEDQIAVGKKLSTLPFIDEDRTGIWGWSYGGFMSTNCILKGNDTFEMAIAVAPVTSWAFYDTVYTERYMRTPQENPSGYDDNSPFNYPELLKGKYLLVHGSGDDNVHVQNTMRMVEALVQANKSFDWAIYPDKNHGIRGGNTSLHLYTKMTNFIKENL